MKAHAVRLFLFLACVGLLMQNARADKADSNDAMEMMRLVVGLNRYAEQQRDPLVMLVAAKLQQRIGARVEGAGAKQKSAADGASLDVSVESMLAKAREYANGRADIIALADDIAAMSSRGTEIGPWRGRRVSRANMGENFEYSYSATEPAIFEIQGDGGSDLLLEVADDSGSVVCVTVDSGDRKKCEWTPASDATYQLKVFNRGDKPNLFDYFHN